MNLFEQFKIHWHRKFSSDNNRAVLLAVSGGADSMVMCDLFLKAKIKFGVAHCNFQLRGEDADGGGKGRGQEDRRSGDSGAATGLFCRVANEQSGEVPERHRGGPAGHGQGFLQPDRALAGGRSGQAGR